ncbi:MAG: prolipoprotein diacylglyceryl transferase [Anaerolineae bacterium]|nr:prolipoprotein diacylglyceryl transferase [Anaerolineae bacterium]
MNPVAFQIGSLTIYWYGILIVISVLVGAYVAMLQARRYGQEPERVWDALLICLILGVIGARLYHVFSTPQGNAVGWPYYREDPAAILRIWEGGLGLLGAILGGALGLAIYAKLAKIPTLVWLDIAAPALLLAQTVGRWGNYINQELYGPPTTLPWGIPIAADYRIAPFNDLAQYPPETLFQPVFLYESLWCMIGFVLLWWAIGRFKSVLRAGDAFLLYVIWYAVGRFGIEALRPDAWMFGPIAAAQVFCAIAFVGALAAFIIRRRLGRAPSAEAGVESEAA